MIPLSEAIQARESADAAISFTLVKLVSNNLQDVSKLANKMQSAN